MSDTIMRIEDAAQDAHGEPRRTPDPCAPTSRRRILKAALGVAAAAVGAGALLETPTGAAEASAPERTLGQTTFISATTVPTVNATNTASSAAVRGHSSNHGVEGLSSGDAAGVYGSGTTGVYGIGTSIGTGYSFGVSGVANGPNGRGVFAAGGAACLALIPSGAATHPTAGNPGDVFVDAGANLWYCKGGTNWTQLA